MSAYQDFASVYDRFMDNIPYEDWSRYLISLFRDYAVTEGTLVELGCGTGNITTYMVAAGYHVLGMDISTDMLNVAADKTAEISSIELICQDMRQLELPDLYKGIYCVCDGLNYLLSDSDMLDTFRHIKQYLRPNGIFIFDFKTLYFYEAILGDQVFCDNREDCSYIWENSYFPEDRINQYDLTLFIREEDSPFFSRFQELHHQKAYTLKDMIDFLQGAGLEYVTAYDAFTRSAPNAESERIYIIARNGESS